MIVSTAVPDGRLINRAGAAAAASAAGRRGGRWRVQPQPAGGTGATHSVAGCHGHRYALRWRAFCVWC